uniref:Ribosomal silencing factor RsfS n=1 Tax=Aureoumbra lagunensis TaxID=44058 RepID=A0A7S3JUL9_9STRA|mmetsp:Transcript_6870/g.9609  ORF Transcript_6870/g.9609 Transcript_6870/m.9609 type:complete len:270 (-) Transcript_6870:52-861(-)
MMCASFRVYLWLLLPVIATGWQVHKLERIKNLMTQRQRPLFATSGKKEKPQRNRPKGMGRTAQNRRRDQLVQGMIDLPKTPKPTSGLEDDDLIPLVKCAAKAADMRKSSETVAYHVASVTDMTCFILLTNGRSKPQNEAIAAAVVDEVEEDIGRLPERIEGGADGGWTVIDYGDVIIHVMTPLSREYYQLDTLWQNKNGVQSIDLSDVIISDNPVDEIFESDEEAAFNPDEGLFFDDWDDLFTDDDAILTPVQSPAAILLGNEEEDNIM